MPKSEKNNSTQDKMQPDDLLRMCRILRHRLRNIASGIRGAVSIIQEESRGQIPNDLQEYFPLMLKECDSLQDMASRLSIIFDTPPLPADTDTARNITDAVCEEVSAAFPHVEYRRLYPEQNITAPIAIKTALQEIMLNACEAAPRGVVAVKIDHDETTLKWSVLDSGPAMDQKTRQQIFDPFFTTRPRHLGLGLPIALRIARMHHGDCKLITDNGAPNKYAFQLTCARDQPDTGNCC